ncbi:MAG TPA: ferrochelatase [Thermomicrobiales bacterium]|nr:ferrochelatase [Thermomicrobiales bacterium]
MAQSGKNIGVLIMAYGGPNSLDEVEPFLADIRRGRPTPKELLDEITERYRAIGGRSPILELTTAQAKSIERELNATGDGNTYRCYVGMRHWHPYIEEVVPQILKDGVDLIVGAVMAPHFSRMSVGAYMGKLEKALKESGAEVPVAQVRTWKAEPDFINSVVAKIEAAFAEHFSDRQWDDVVVLFTAHSLPARVEESGDPYRQEILASVELVAEQMGLTNYRFAFQSQGATADPWLGPSVEETLDEFESDGVKDMLIVPIGFVCDHVEVLFDIDIEHKEQATEKGIRLERTEMLNDDPGLAKAVANAVRAAVAEAA